MSPSNPHGTKPRVQHFIGGLGLAGAELSLAKLIERSRSELSHEVVVLAGTALNPILRDLGVSVIELGLDRPGWLARAPHRAVRATWRSRPNVVQGWMY